MASSNGRKDIRSRRLELGISQADLAHAAQVTNYRLRMWERGLELPDAPALKRLAEALGCRVTSLRRAQLKHTTAATPGEGYTTSHASSGEEFSRAKQPPRAQRRVLDLFCGAGGFSFGFEQTGEFVATCGIDLLGDRIQTFLRNHPFASAIAGDLRAVPVARVASLAGAVDTLVGGPPCQGFSSIRPFRNLTEGDRRNSLVEQYVLLVAELQPRWIVFENVVGLLTHQGGLRLEQLLSSLDSIGYRTDWRVINAALFGVPQHRERVVVVGSRDGTRFLWPTPTSFAQHKSMAGKRAEVIRTEPLFSRGLPSAVTLMDAIGDLPPVAAGEESFEYLGSEPTPYQKEMRADGRRLTLHKATSHSARMLEIIQHAGGNISALPKGMVKSGFSSCYSKLAPDRPSTTLTVNFVHPASNRCIHPFQQRALTPREGARIQSFPDYFEFVGTSAQIVKQIGNAVPPKVARAIAQGILTSDCQAGRTHQESSASDAAVTHGEPPLYRLT